LSGAKRRREPAAEILSGAKDLYGTAHPDGPVVAALDGPAGRRGYEKSPTSRKKREKWGTLAFQTYFAVTSEWVMAWTESAMRFCTPTLRINLAT